MDTTQKIQLCPKCNGQGTVSKPPWVAGDVHEWVSPSTSFVCNLCNGLKYLVLPVPDEPKAERWAVVRVDYIFSKAFDADAYRNSLISAYDYKVVKLAD